LDFAYNVGNIQAILTDFNYNRVYCANNPVMYTDSDGDFPILIFLIAAAYAIWAAQDIYDIVSGDVYFNEAGDGGQIVDSYKVQNPTVVFGYSIYLRYFSDSKDCFDGSATGIAAEWMVHNIGYDLTFIPSKFGYLQNINDRAIHTDLGRTVFAEDDWYVRYPALAIQIVANPITIIYDYYQYIKHE